MREKMSVESQNSYHWFN